MCFQEEGFQDTSEVIGRLDESCSCHRQEAKHIHHAIMCKNDQEINKHQFVYHITKKGETDFAFYCSITKILSMNKLKPNTPKDKQPDVVSASSEE